MSSRKFSGTRSWVCTIIFTETTRVTLLLRGIGFLDVPSCEGAAGLGVALSGLVREDVVASGVPPV